MNKTNAKAAEQAAPEFLLVRPASTEKGSGGTLGYEVGRHVASGEPGLRIVSNSSSGTFSKEWVPLGALRRALSGAPERFPASTLAPAIVAKGKNNAFFFAAALVGEGLLARHAEGGLTLAGDWQAWEDGVRQAEVQAAAPSPAPAGDGEARAPSEVPPPEKKGGKAGRKSKDPVVPAPAPDGGNG